MTSTSTYEKYLAVTTSSTADEKDQIEILADDITNIIEKGVRENANLQHNPETIHKLVADLVMKKYVLTKILPPHLANAHMRGEIHIHDLEYFATRPYCFQHDLRWFLKNGLKVDGTGEKHCSCWSS